MFRAVSPALSPCQLHSLMGTAHSSAPHSGFRWCGSRARHSTSGCPQATFTGAPCKPHPGTAVASGYGCTLTLRRKTLFQGVSSSHATGQTSQVQFRRPISSGVRQCSNRTRVRRQGPRVSTVSNTTLPASSVTWCGQEESAQHCVLPAGMPQASDAFGYSYSRRRGQPPRGEGAAATCPAGEQDGHRLRPGTAHPSTRDGFDRTGCWE
jgi:hypothetical protein